MKSPDPEWLAYMPWLFGFLLLCILAFLVGLIALGKVEQATSFGLPEIIGAISVLTGVYANATFGKKDQ